MQYTAIIKDGGLFIPNIMAHIKESTASSMVKVNLDLIEEVVASPSKNDEDLNDKDLADNIMAFSGCWQDLDEDFLSSDDISNRRSVSSRERYL